MSLFFLLFRHRRDFDAKTYNAKERFNSVFELYELAHACQSQSLKRKQRNFLCQIESFLLPPSITLFVSYAHTQTCAHTCTHTRNQAQTHVQALFCMCRNTKTKVKQKCTVTARVCAEIRELVCRAHTKNRLVQRLSYSERNNTSAGEITRIFNMYSL